MIIAKKWKLNNRLNLRAILIWFGLDDEVVLINKRPSKMNRRAGSDYIPLVDEEISKFRVICPIPKVAWFTVSLPFFGFIFCIIWSIMYNFEHATSTHCKVYNFLPSVSATIGHYRPQKDVWKAAIASQAVVRALLFIMYYRYYKETVYAWARGICNIALTSYFLENLSLVTLSFWTSNENYAFHKLSFITFLIMSLIHMLLAFTIIRNYRNAGKDSNDMASLKWKLRMLILNVSSIILAGYFFYRHNKYCEPMIYSMFALAEYGVVITNMGFHLTAALDFAGRSLLLSTRSCRLI